MIETRGDIWHARKPGDWIAITINGMLRKDGKLVMGRGIALEASTKYPLLQAEWGKVIAEGGLRVFLDANRKLIAFPTKHNFWEKSDINLILRSTIQLLEVEPTLGGGQILMPRPGCGNGHLDWAEVEPMLRHYLTSDRFVVFSK